MNWVGPVLWPELYTSKNGKKMLTEIELKKNNKIYILEGISVEANHRTNDVWIKGYDINTGKLMRVLNKDILYTKQYTEEERIRDTMVWPERDTEEKTEINTIPEGPPDDGPVTAIYGIPTPPDTMKYTEDDAAEYETSEYKKTVFGNSADYMNAASDWDRSADPNFLDDCPNFDFPVHLNEMNGSITEELNGVEESDLTFTDKLKRIGRDISRIKNGESFIGMAMDDAFGEGIGRRFVRVRLNPDQEAKKQEERERDKKIDSRRIRNQEIIDHCFDSTKERSKYMWDDLERKNKRNGEITILGSIILILVIIWIITLFVV
jgi:hypothetical protein